MTRLIFPLDVSACWMLNCRFDLGKALLHIPLLHELCTNVGVEMAPEFLRRAETDEFLFAQQEPVQAFFSFLMPDNYPSIS